MTDQTDFEAFTEALLRQVAKSLDLSYDDIVADLPRASPSMARMSAHIREGLTVAGRAHYKTTITDHGGDGLLVTAHINGSQAKFYVPYIDLADIPAPNPLLYAIEVVNMTGSPPDLASKRMSPWPDRTAPK